MIRKGIVLLGLVITFFTTIVNAQLNGLPSADAFNAGVSYANPLPKRSQAVLANPAYQLTEERQTEAYLSAENRYGWNVLRRYTAALATPLRAGTGIGVGVDYFGDNVYHESTVTTAVSHSIENVNMGMQLTWAQIGTEGVASKNALFASIGAGFKLNPKWKLATYIRNINRAKLPETNDERLPSYIDVGTQYKATDKLNIYSTISLQTLQQPNFRFGLNYNLHRIVSLQSGYRNDLESFSFGAIIHHKKLHFAYSIYTHPVLPISHLIGLKVTLSKKENG